MSRVCEVRLIELKAWKIGEDIYTRTAFLEEDHEQCRPGGGIA